MRRTSIDNLRIRLFGAPTIALKGEPVGPGRRKVIAYVSYLSANEARHFPRAKIDTLRSI